MSCKNKEKLRASKNRDFVISILRKENVPVSVENIYCKVKDKNKSVSLSTIYRIIDKLCELNIVQKTATDNNKTLYELVQNGHKHYAICTNCKKMIPLDNCPIHELEKNISDNTGFCITGHKYEIYGICKDCHGKNPIG